MATRAGGRFVRQPRRGRCSFLLIARSGPACHKRIGCDAKIPARPCHPVRFGVVWTCYEFRHHANIRARKPPRTGGISGDARPLRHFPHAKPHPLSGSGDGPARGRSEPRQDAGEPLSRGRFGRPGAGTARAHRRGGGGEPHAIPRLGEGVSALKSSVARLEQENAGSQATPCAGPEMGARHERGSLIGPAVQERNPHGPNGAPLHNPGDVFPVREGEFAYPPGEFAVEVRFRVLFHA